MANNEPVIIKKVKKGGGGGHHGGAWKIAYADFVTAMMAFFLLMWLINMTSPDQKKGLSEYFSPPTVSDQASGAGGLLGGQSISSDESVSDGGQPTLSPPRPEGTSEIDTPDPGRGGTAADSDATKAGGSSDNAKSGGPTAKGMAAGFGAMTEEDAMKRVSGDKAGFGKTEQKGPQATDKSQQAQADKESAAFAEIEQDLREAVQSAPELKDLENQLVVDQTPEGLRIQIIDQEGRSMFPSGGTDLNPRARQLLAVVAKTVKTLPNRVAVAGHTDGLPFGRNPNYGNFELSTDRANAARRALVADGMPNNKIYQVVGKADSEPLFPEDPTLAGNRRISVVILRETPVMPPRS